VAFARLRIAAQVLYRVSARPVTTVSNRINALEVCSDNVLVQDFFEQVMHPRFRAPCLHFRAVLGFEAGAESLTKLLSWPSKMRAG
jgi:hypothetical protein